MLSAKEMMLGEAYNARSACARANVVLTLWLMLTYLLVHIQQRQQYKRRRRSQNRRNDIEMRYHFICVRFIGFTLIEHF